MIIRAGAMYEPLQMATFAREREREREVKIKDKEGSHARARLPTIHLIPLTSIKSMVV